ncbi:MAG: DUF6491 family protein [Rhizomicrobium sp.]
MRLSLPILASVCGLLLAAAPAAADPAARHSQCFFVNGFENWKAPDARTIYIRVNLHRYYRLDLANSCSALLMPDSHLITKWRGSSSVCSALDWDLKVSQGFPGAATPCIVKTMTELTAEEAAAIPKKFKP